MKLTHLTKTLVFLFVIISVFYACNDDDISTDSTYKLSFKSDVYTFDTVFTTIGSTTQRIKIYNKNKEDLNITSINLSGGNSSPFRINVNGQNSANQSFTNVRINANDSLYIFVQLNVDPTNQSAPILISDSICFKVNGNTQYIRLEAYGQDVYILRDVTFTNDTLLSNTKPYLIYGNLTIAANKTLTIEKGNTLYFHENSGILVHGNLQAIGTLSEPIIFRGDRLDNLFDDVPYDGYYSGQWKGIYFTSQTGIHQLEFVRIRNAINGLHLLCGATSKPQLTLRNSILHNFDSCGLVARNAKLEIINTQISNSISYCLSVLGGEFNIVHSTFANYKSDRTTAAVLIKNHIDDGNSLYPITLSEMKNCIINGTMNEELRLDYKVNNIPVDTFFTVNIAYCLVNGTPSTDSHFSNILWSNPSQLIFNKTDEYPFNFGLLASSPARNTGDMTTANLHPTDLAGNSRIADSQGDMGAYEWVNP